MSCFVAQLRIDPNTSFHVCASAPLRENSCTASPVASTNSEDEDDEQKARQQAATI